MKKSMISLLAGLGIAAVAVAFVLNIVPKLANSTTAEQQNNYTYAQEVGDESVYCYVDGLTKKSFYKDLNIPATAQLTKLGNDEKKEYTIKGIAKGAFKGENQMETVVIPSSVNVIGEDAFKDCGKLKSVTYEGNKTQWEQMQIASGNDTLENATVTFLG